MGEFWIRALYKKYLDSPGRLSIVATSRYGDDPIGGIFASSISDLKPANTLPSISIRELRLINWKALFRIKFGEYLDLLQVLRLISQLKANPRALYISSWFAFSTSESPNVGSQLLRYFLDCAQRDGYSMVYVDVRIANNRAIKKYEDQGFTIYKSTRLSHLLAKNLTY